MRSYLLNRSILTCISIAAITIFPASILAQTPELPPPPVPTQPPVQSLPPAQTPAQTPEQSPVQPPEQIPAPPPAPTSAPESAVPPGYQVVMGERWSFAVPSDWQAVPAADLSDVEGNIRIVARLSDSPRQTIVNLITQSYQDSRDDYLKRSIGELGDLGFQVNQQHDITVGTLSGSELDVSVPNANPPVRLLQRIIADENGTGFVMTCGSPEANFATAQTVCATILNSLQVAP